MPNQTKIVVAMSGGVDSSVTAALLQRQGYEVCGLHMDMGLAHKNRLDEHGQVTGDRADVIRVAEMLGVELHLVDFSDAIGQVIDYFIDEYRRGRTPNPCIMCNRKLKFGRILQFADSVGAGLIATGHYARIIETEGGYRLCRALNHAKDQSYALFGIGYETLRRVRLPLGQFAKDEIREMARQMELPVHDKGDSQEICFVPDDDYVRFLEEKAPDLRQPGPIVHTSGKVLGEHQGVYRYTIGQRRGLGVALGTPAYVVAIDPVSRTVTLGEDVALLREGLVAEHVCWMTDEPPCEPFQASIQIRYNHRGANGVVIPQPGRPGEPTRVEVRFDEPIRAVTPGQAAVFYRDDGIVGGGWIVREDE